MIAMLTSTIIVVALRMITLPAIEHQSMIAGTVDSAVLTFSVALLSLLLATAKNRVPSLIAIS